MGNRPRRRGNHRARAVLVAVLTCEELDDPKRQLRRLPGPCSSIPAKDRYLYHVPVCRRCLRAAEGEYSANTRLWGETDHHRKIVVWGRASGDLARCSRGHSPSQGSASRDGTVFPAAPSGTLDLSPQDVPGRNCCPAMRPFRQRMTRFASSGSTGASRATMVECDPPIDRALRRDQGCGARIATGRRTALVTR